MLLNLLVLLSFSPSQASQTLSGTNGCVVFNRDDEAAYAPPSIRVELLPEATRRHLWIYNRAESLPSTSNWDEALVSEPVAEAASLPPNTQLVYKLNFGSSEDLAFVPALSLQYFIDVMAEIGIQQSSLMNAELALHKDAFFFRAFEHAVRHACEGAKSLSAKKPTGPLMEHLHRLPVVSMDQLDGAFTAIQSKQSTMKWMGRSNLKQIADSKRRSLERLVAVDVMASLRSLAEEDRLMRAIIKEQLISKGQSIDVAGESIAPDLRRAQFIRQALQDAQAHTVPRELLAQINDTPLTLVWLYQKSDALGWAIVSHLREPRRTWMIDAPELDPYMARMARRGYDPSSAAMALVQAFRLRSTARYMMRRY